MLYIVGNSKGREIPQGRWWGCNAVYRDANPEILFTVDIPMQREIIEHGYADGNKVAVGEWDYLPIEMLDIMRSGFKNVVESVRPFDTHFVVQGDDESTTILGLSDSQMKNIIMYNNPILKNLFCGMSALGYACLHNEKEITLVGMSALEDGNYENQYQGTDNYPSKYNEESRVINAQRSQFISLLQEFEDVEIYFENPLTNNAKVEYNKLYYYESSERWILSQGFESDTMQYDV